MATAAKTVWIAEAKYKDVPSWYTLWTTCRLYKSEAKKALNDHPGLNDFSQTRVVKFERRSLTEGK